MQASAAGCRSQGWGQEDRIQALCGRMPQSRLGGREDRMQARCGIQHEVSRPADSHDASCREFAAVHVGAVNLDHVHSCAEIGRKGGGPDMG